MEFNKEELEMAISLLSSTITKCEKMQLKFSEGTSQHSLLKNRIKALYISKSLLSGDKTMLKTAEIYKIYSEILTLVNTATIDSTDINYSFTKTIGNPEHLYLRMTFNSPHYKDLGEFSILTILTEEKGVDELYKGYIIVKHSETHRYFLKISENMELWNKLNELAHIDHGNLLEKNP